MQDHLPHIHTITHIQTNTHNHTVPKIHTRKTYTITKYIYTLKKKLRSQIKSDIKHKRISTVRTKDTRTQLIKYTQFS